MYHTSLTNTHHQQDEPNRLWYLAHVVSWVISGLICWLVWKDKNRHMANRHLIVSLWLAPVISIVFILIGLGMAALFGEPVGMYENKEMMHDIAVDTFFDTVD